MNMPAGTYRETLCYEYSSDLRDPKSFQGTAS